MSRTWLLLRTTLVNYFSINEIFDSSSKKKNGAAIMVFGIITLAIFIGVYTTITANILVDASQGDMIPAYMVSMSSFAILIFMLLRSNGILFGCRDFEMLCGLPVKTREIITSKFGFMYLLNLLFTILFMIPAGIVWCMNTDSNLQFVLLYFLSVSFVPLIPMCISSFIGVAITVVSSKFRNKNLVAVILSFLTLGLVGLIAMLSQQSGVEENLGVMLAQQLNSLYPISRMFFIESNVSYFNILLFILISSIVFWIFIWIVTPRYIAINTLVVTSKYNSVIRKGTLKEHSKFIALYQKEIKRFLGSYMVFLNTGLGVVMLSAFSIILLIAPSELIEKTVGIPNLDEFLPLYAPLIISGLLALSCTTASSISLEGKQIWILQSSPISPICILNSKIAMNLSLHSIGYFLAVLAFSLKLSLTSMQLASMIFIPIIYSLFISIQGVYLNCCFPNFDWDNEMVVVKQSISVILSTAVGMLSIAVPVLLILFLKTPILLTLIGTASLLLVATFSMYMKCLKTKIF